MDSEIRNELLKLRDEGLLIEGEIDFGVFLIQTENLSEMTEAFIENVVTEVVESKFGPCDQDTEGRFFIDLVTREVCFEAKFHEIVEVETNHDIDDLMGKVDNEFVEKVKSVVAKVLSVNENICYVHVHYSGHSGLTEGAKEVNFAYDKEGSELDIPCQDDVWNAIEHITEDLTTCCGHSGYWKDDGGGGFFCISCNNHEHPISEYRHYDNIEEHSSERLNSISKKLSALIEGSGSKLSVPRF